MSSILPERRTCAASLELGIEIIILALMNLPRHLREKTLPVAKMDGHFFPVENIS